MKFAMFRTERKELRASSAGASGDFSLRKYFDLSSIINILSSYNFAKISVVSFFLFSISVKMYSALRPAARRLFSVRPNASSFIARSRSIATQSIAFSRPAATSSVSSFQQIQRRWNSDEATKVATEKAVTSTQEVKAEGEAALEAAARNAASEQVSTVDATSAETEALLTEQVSAGSQERDAAAGEDELGFRVKKPVRRTIDNLTPSPTVYVGNLFFDVTAEDLKNRMQSYGVIEKATIIHDARGLSKGFGYVTFDSVEAAQRAIDEMSQQIYEGRRVLVQFSASGPSEKQSRPKSKPTRSLYIGNLAYDLSDRELNDIFKSVRNVVEVRVAVDRQSGSPRGFAHADFLDIPSAQAALEILSSKAPHGRRLRVDFSQGVKKGRREPRDQAAANTETENATNEAEGKAETQN
ncbi:nucleic acid-binding protein [Talaromyces stipitatus ATCC 10500]|uniref:Nucleic acid-binding protein n=1 Tax=Talaromyces stipitatus (strain ATCC 10500 / CBS 375.48 / QM 6759 / NRRL 1006) TaxID=441959 RepID=B8MQL0_TALSN|nr:nucleic acid-binding protein [Talaromyces stipitatus ATCC 10500]EED13412.1 nucleic acid-binding protein [Talaromyces stipitatus ATCC 10500]